MKDARGAEIRVGDTVVYSEKNSSYGQSGFHPAVGIVLRLGVKWPVVRRLTYASSRAARPERAVDSTKCVVVVELPQVSDA